MIWPILISILVLYLFFALTKDLIKRNFRISICAVCIAVSLTWLILLILYFAKLFDDKIIIAILMGQSIVGIMYAFDERFKKNKSIAALKIFIILFGTLFVYYLLQ